MIVRPKSNYASQRFGKITLQAPIPGRPGYWQGQCDCGNAVAKRIDNLKRPGEHSCGQCILPSSVPANTTTTDRLKALEEQTSHLHQVLAELNVRGAIPADIPAQPSITSQEGQAIWFYIEEMKTWLKNEIGVRLTRLEKQTEDSTQRAEHPGTSHGQLSQQADAITALTERIAALEQPMLPAIPSAPKSPIQVPAGQASATEPVNGQTQNPTNQETPAASTRRKIYPLQAYPYRPIQKHFYYRETEEGLDLETTLKGKVESLGFFDTLKELREAIKDYLYEKNYVADFIEELIPAIKNQTV